MNNSIESIMKKAAADMGISLSSAALCAFVRYCDILYTRSLQINLTAIKNKEDIIRLHFLDSLALLNVADFKDAKVLDIGSGAGFPGLPLKIAEPSIELTLLDATKKRVSFLTELCRELSIKVLCLHARAEDVAHTGRMTGSGRPCVPPDGSGDMRENYDIVVSRAVAKLNVLCELCLPFLRAGGVFPAMKGMDSDEELREALGAIEILGARVISTSEYTIPDTDVRHRIILIEKISQTPDRFPRRFARIEKKPL